MELVIVICDFTIIFFLVHITMQKGMHIMHLHACIDNIRMAAYIKVSCIEPTFIQHLLNNSTVCSSENMQTQHPGTCSCTHCLCCTKHVHWMSILSTYGKVHQRPFGRPDVSWRCRESASQQVSSSCRPVCRPGERCRRGGTSPAVALTMTCGSCDRVHR